MAAEEAAEELGMEVATLPEYQTLESDEELAWTSGVGEWDGQTYSMKYFPCMPENVEEGNLTWSQTMGKVYISYLLTDEANISVEDVKMDVARGQIKTKVAGKDLKVLSGVFFSFVRAGATWWNIIDVEEGKKLYIVLQKFEHAAWKSLFRQEIFVRVAFSWTAKSQGMFYKAEDEKLRQIKADSPIDSLEVPDDISWQRMCIGLDDFQDTEEFVVITLHFDPKELEAINRTVPTEELFGADITENEVAVYFRVYEYGQPVVAFHGVLEGKCVPQLTTWEFLHNTESRHPLIAGYTPAVQLVLTKQADSQSIWPQVFSSAKHASELHAPSYSLQFGGAKQDAAPAANNDESFNFGGATIKPSAGPPAWLKSSAGPPASRQADNAERREPQGPAVNQEAVVVKFRALLKEGLSSRDATSQAIEFVRSKAAAGEPWALAGFARAVSDAAQE